MLEPQYLRTESDRHSTAAVSVSLHDGAWFIDPKLSGRMIACTLNRVILNKEHEEVPLDKMEAPENKYSSMQSYCKVFLSKCFLVLVLLKKEFS